MILIHNLNEFWRWEICTSKKSNICTLAGNICRRERERTLCAIVFEWWDLALEFIRQINVELWAVWPTVLLNPSHPDGNKNRQRWRTTDTKNIIANLHNHRLYISVLMCSFLFYCRAARRCQLIHPIDHCARRIVHSRRKTIHNKMIESPRTRFICCFDSTAMRTDEQHEGNEWNVKKECTRTKE